MPQQRPAVIAFDVVETLFSLDAVRQRLVGAGLPQQALELWFARALRDAFALTASDDYQPFRQIAGSALEQVLAQHDVAVSETSTILDGFSELEAHPDVAPALQMLVDSGVSAIALTNSAADMTRALIERASLTSMFTHILSADESERLKPHPEPYRYAARVAGVEPGELALVAVHSWDILGARRAGLVTGWASRLETHFPPALGKPDVSGQLLTEVVDGLLQLPAR